MNDNLLLQPDVNGFVQEKFLRHVLIKEIRNTRLNGYVPSNASNHGVTNGAPEEYAEYFILLIKKHNGMNAYKAMAEQSRSTGSLEQVGRIGLFSINPLTAFGITSVRELLDPKKNIIVGLKLYEELIIKTGKLPTINGVIPI